MYCNVGAEIDLSTLRASRYDHSLVVMDVSIEAATGLRADVSSGRCRARQQGQPTSVKIDRASLTCPWKVNEFQKLLTSTLENMNCNTSMSPDEINNKT